MSQSIKLSDYISTREHDQRAARAEWEIMKTRADYVIRMGADEMIHGESIDITADEQAEIAKRLGRKTDQ